MPDNRSEHQRRLPRGNRSDAVRRPCWYVRRLKPRPTGVCRRGPYRPRRPLVDEAPRVTAEELWSRADPTLQTYVWTGDAWRLPEDAGSYPSERGMRHYRIGEAAITLVFGAPYPIVGRNGPMRRVFACCPECGGNSRILYLVESPIPRCRKCCGLVYRSSAARRSRWKARIDAACAASAQGKRVNWDRVAPAWFRTRWSIARRRIAEREEM